MRYFGFVGVQDAKYRTLLNAAILLADPSEKTPVHVTVSGPFSARPRHKAGQNHVAGEKISVIGVDRFVGAKQSTVFLECGFPSARGIWNKKDYGFKPHLTIFDGKDIEFADRLYGRLQKKRLFFNFRAGPLYFYKSVSGQKGFEAALSLDFRLLGCILPNLSSLEDFKNLTTESRLCGIELIIDECNKVHTTV